MNVKLAAVVAVSWSLWVIAGAAHGFGASITWNREISRLVYDRCASCHRPGGTAFSLMAYTDAQPRANEIKAAVLARRMPPWGAVKGFGTFRNDSSLSQEQIELISRWVDGGIRRGNNPGLLPKPPVFETPPAAAVPGDAMRVTGAVTLSAPLLLDGLLPESVPADRSIRVAVRLPGGSVEPLVWLHGYDNRYRHAFLLRRPMLLPPGATIEGVPPDTVIALLTPAK